MVEIAVVGKYVDLIESYKSVNEALIHGGIAHEIRINFRYVDAERLDKQHNLRSAFHRVDAVLVPGGFGERGIAGKIAASQICSEQIISRFLVYALGYKWRSLNLLAM